jgi:hypothetical protein
MKTSISSMAFLVYLNSDAGNNEENGTYKKHNKPSFFCA